MKLEYKWTEEDLKKELVKKRLIPNIMFFILGIVLYILIMYTGIESKMFDNKIILLYGFIYAVVLLLMLFISTKIFVYISLKKNKKNDAYGNYVVKLNNKEISLEVNNTKINYKYKDIIKYKKRKNYLFVRTKEDKIGLIFKKSVLGEDDYNKLIEYIEKVR